ncbi:MAG: hypothetical protein PVI06_15395, partial [Desulfobacterales bacterium]
MPPDKPSGKGPGRKTPLGQPTLPLPENFESQRQFQHIISLLQKSPPLDLPPDLTEKVMSRIAARKQRPIYEQIREAFNKINIRRWTEVSDRTECALCFFMAGFFYFVFAFVLLMGLKAVGARIQLAGWIIVQPQLAFIIALGFSAIGIILIKKSDSAVKIAQVGSIIYIGFSVFNAIGIQRAPGNPFSAAGLICFGVGTLLLGLFLI